MEDGSPWALLASRDFRLRRVFGVRLLAATTRASTAASTVSDHVITSLDRLNLRRPGWRSAWSTSRCYS